MARTTLSQILIRSAIVVVVLVTAAMLYNRYLIDDSLERIRTALDETSSGEVGGPRDTYAFQDLLTAEISREDRQLSLDLVKESLWPDQSAQKSSVQFLLEDLLSSYQKNRPLIFRAFDFLSRFVTTQLNQAAQFAQFILKHGTQKESHSLESTQLADLRRAREYELDWKFDEAAKAYQSFIQTYPSYENLNLVRINLASVFLRSENFDAARKELNGVRISMAKAEDVKLVSSLKKKIGEQWELSVKREDLAHIAQTGKDPSAWFEIGVYDLRLFNLERAQSSFERVLELKPDPEIEKRTQWILSRIFLLRNDLQESRRHMQELLQKVS